MGPILLKLSSMVGLSNERDRKLISVRTGEIGVQDLAKFQSVKDVMKRAVKLSKRFKYLAIPLT